MTWLIVVVDAGARGLHIMPTDEEALHLKTDCTCGVHFDEDAQAHIHHSFDGREAFESGERLPS